jgi:carbon storage regulator
MLVLTIEIGKSLHVNENIQIEVLGIERGVVKLGITAPREVKVYRDEVYRRIRVKKLNDSMTMVVTPLVS